MTESAKCLLFEDNLLALDRKNADRYLQVAQRFLQANPGRKEPFEAWHVNRLPACLLMRMDLDTRFRGVDHKSFPRDPPATPSHKYHNRSVPHLDNVINENPGHLAELSDITIHHLPEEKYTPLHEAPKDLSIDALQHRQRMETSLLNHHLQTFSTGSLPPNMIDTLALGVPDRMSGKLGVAHNQRSVETDHVLSELEAFSQVLESRSCYAGHVKTGKGMRVDVMLDLDEISYSIFSRHRIYLMHHAFPHNQLAGGDIIAIFL